MTEQKQQVNKVIQIMSCSNDNYWYNGNIGAYIEVLDIDDRYYITKSSGIDKLQFEYILKTDCEFMYMSNENDWSK